MTKLAPNLRSVFRIVASWFGTGLILGRLRGSDTGSGTVGALFTFPIAYAIGAWWGWLAQIVAALLVIALSMWSVRPLVDSAGDAGWIVVDEAAGTFVAVIGLSLAPAVLAWVVFRLADIKKELAPGVAQAESLHGAAGVTADDVVAGLYGLAIGLLAQTMI